MQQTKPLFIIRKYRSILRASVIVEAVLFIASLTDSIVAGNALGEEALAAIGLIAPFFTFSVFVSVIVSSGTAKQYSYYVGSFDKRRALEFFSQGAVLAIAAGAVYAGALLLFREAILSHIADPGEIRRYAQEYYDVMLLFFFLNPLLYLLDVMLVADGGEKLSALSNATSIALNVALSVLFVGRWGVRGVAVATVLSRLAFILFVCLHFFDRKNTLRLIFHWKGADIFTIVRGGFVIASTYALEALTIFVLNLFAVRFFDGDTLILLVMAERFLGLLTVFLGLSMSTQSLIGTLNGEKNSRALRELMKTACRYMISAGVLLTLFTQLFAPFLVRAFGIDDGALPDQGVVALRIVSVTLVFHALLALFFTFYYLIGRELLAFAVGMLKGLLSPLVLAILLSVLTDSRTGLWVGLTAAPVVSLLVCAWGICRKCGRERFPFLIPKETDEKIFIYDFDVSPENAAAMSRTAGELLRSLSVSGRVCTMAGLFIEELLLLVREKNAGQKKLYAECTLIAESVGVRLILRDSGAVFDITDEDALADSFRQYVVANMMTTQKTKAYMTTTGYNRNELFFADP
ncbi:MAG: hypothetical protein IK136_00775 [Oscillospiraceae bacterium]|nr:hypothetical protein [Oscillospiraceae bacterium]